MCYPIFGAQKPTLYLQGSECWTQTFLKVRGDRLPGGDRDRASVPTHSLGLCPRTHPHSSPASVDVCAECALCSEPSHGLPLPPSLRPQRRWVSPSPYLDTGRARPEVVGAAEAQSLGLISSAGKNGWSSREHRTT